MILHPNENLMLVRDITWSSFNLSKRVTQTTADLNPALWVRAVNAVDSISMLVTPASFKRSMYLSLSLELYSQNAPSNLAWPKISKKFK